MVTVQVISIDYVMQKYDGIDEFPCPVVRIFGSSAKSLRRYCVYIHGVFPYVYFRPEDVHDNTFDDASVVERYLYAVSKLQISLDFDIEIAIWDILSALWRI